MLEPLRRDKDTLQINSKLLKSRLPPLMASPEEQSKNVAAIFREIIVAKEENRTFFKSPSAYLKKKGVLSFTKVQLEGSPDAVKVFDDATVVKTFRKAREMYQNGAIKVNEIASAIYDTESYMGVIAYERIDSDTYIYSKADNHTAVFVSGLGSLVIDELVIGPLVEAQTLVKLKQQTKALAEGKTNNPK